MRIVDPTRLVLASSSPRRRDLLEAAGVAFEVIPADIPELGQAGEAPEELAMRLSREKALAVAARIGPLPPRRVLGADTIVVLDGRVLGKPDDEDHAAKLLGDLLGEHHLVITGFTLVDSARLECHTEFVASEVVMRTADETEIRAYVATREPLDKAGAYALQGEGARFVESVAGSRSNVIGLPIERILELLGNPEPEP